jgi:hypothetical protein
MNLIQILEEYRRAHAAVDADRRHILSLEQPRKFDTSFAWG